MIYLVGYLSRTAYIAPKMARRAAQDGYKAVVGWNMDDNRRIVFRASDEQLDAYYADKDEDRHVIVQQQDVLRVTNGRSCTSLWPNAGLPWSIG